MLFQINFDLKIKPASAKSDNRKTLAIICLLVWYIGIQFLDMYNLMVTAVKENKICKFYGTVLHSLFVICYSILRYTGSYPTYVYVANICLFVTNRV